MLNYKWKWWISKNKGWPTILNLCMLEATYFPNILKQTHHFVRNVLACQLEILKHSKNPTMPLSMYARAKFPELLCILSLWILSQLTALSYWTRFQEPCVFMTVILIFLQKKSSGLKTFMIIWPHLCAPSVHTTVPGTGERTTSSPALKMHWTPWRAQACCECQVIRSTVLERTACDRGDHGNTRRDSMGTRLHRLRTILINK